MVVHQVLDYRTNSVAPESEIGVAWRTSTNLVPSNATWQYYFTSADSAIFGLNWTQSEFVPGPLWRTGVGVFGVLQNLAPCVGTWGARLNFDEQPILFRTTFQVPPGTGSNAILRFAYSVGDGAIAFFNGKEVFRTNVLAGIAPKSDLRALKLAQLPICVSTQAVSVSNLVAGTNCVAVVLVQAKVDLYRDLAFGLTLDGDLLISPILPPIPPPVLSAQPNLLGQTVLSWSGGGYALESATTLENPLSYPVGPWTEVASMINPWTNSFPNAPARFFRLKRKQ